MDPKNTRPQKLYLQYSKVMFDGSLKSSFILHSTFKSVPLVMVVLSLLSQHYCLQLLSALVGFPYFQILP